MSAVEVLRLAQENGIRLGVVGADLILDAAREPEPDVLEALRRNKAAIVALLGADRDEWSAKDWKAFYDERTGIAEFDGRQSRADAEAIAFECCIVEWLDRHPECSNPDRCAWCGEPYRDGNAVVPFGVDSGGHTWLHPECWSDWRQDRRERAQRALQGMCLDISSETCSVKHTTGVPGKKLDCLPKNRFGRGWP